ncbi:MAG: hydantoinase/oxoprolinase family protein [Chloroflexi bacterium]|nr:hydantoinase/oxoprolinase family protein [Chloroflexota bacterium]
MDSERGGVDAIAGIDVGGTFTDFVLLTKNGIRTHKALSTPDDPLRAIQQGLAELAGTAPTTVIHGTTIVTNAILQNRGARTAFLTTRGFRDLLLLGRQDRPALYDLRARPPDPLVPVDRSLEVAERIAADGQVVEGLTAETVARLAVAIRALDVEAVAICLLFSFLHPDHERRLAAALREHIPGLFISLSSDVAPEFREYERASTTVIDAFTGPLTARYLARAAVTLPDLQLMQSSGGLTTPQAAAEHPVCLALSGPAGGVAGAIATAGRECTQLLTFDMGGTSTDVALCDGGVPFMAEASLGGWPLRQSMVAVHTIGAGGGSVAWVDAGGALRVGPQSAGAEPGPACYGRGELPTVTDANLFLGRLPSTGLLGGRMPLSSERARTVLAHVGAAVGLSAEETAVGMVRIVNAAMVRALAHVSIEQGHDAREFTLLPFGGAGPLHACELAEALDIQTIFLPRYPGLLSALGMVLAGSLHDVRQGLLRRADAVGEDEWQALFTPLQAQAERTGAADAEIMRFADLRYCGQSFELTVTAGGTLASTVERFHQAHEQRYGYLHRSRPVEIVTLRVRSQTPARHKLPPYRPESGAVSLGDQLVWLQDHWVWAPVLAKARLIPGTHVRGPALLVQDDATALVTPGWSGTVDDAGALMLGCTHD